MSEFRNNTIPQGTRKKTEYLNDRRAQLALQIQRSDGGMLQIPMLSETRSTWEEESIQRNTLLSILPLTRLPGHDKPEQSPRGGLPRRGRIYVFWNNVLWRELETDGQGQLFEVDIAHWRTIARQLGNAEQRDPVGIEQHVMLLPMLLQGRFVADQFLMAYSELPWSWEYIDWLESDANRIKARCQNIARIWDTAVVGSEHWKTSQTNPSLPVSRIRKGLRARDFNIESALQDPLEFTPALSSFSDENLLKRLQMRQEQLAQHLQQPPPPPLPEIEAGVDLLDQYQLRDHRHLVGLILDDPLFAVRHATAQIRHCVAYLQTLNALIAHQPNGRYAQVLYSAVGGDHANLKGKIDLPKFHATVFEQERRFGRELLRKHLMRLVAVLDRKLPNVLLDWVHRHDQALLEPYSLMADALGALEYLPAQADALCTDLEITDLETSIRSLVQGVLQAEHPLGSLLLSSDPERPPELLKRLIALRDSDQPVEPQAMGLSTLILGTSFIDKLDGAGVAKSFAYFMGDLLDIFGASVVAQISRLSSSASKIKLDRLFTPTFTTLSALSKKMVGIRLMPMGEALAKELVVIGIHGAGLRRGLTNTERAELTRKNYRYATLHSQSGETLGSTSAKGSGKNDPMLRNILVIALPKEHPELESYSNFRVKFGALTQYMEKTKIVPTLMLGLAVYNLVVQMDSFKDFKADGKGLRGVIGASSAFFDMAAALSNHSKLLLGTRAKRYLTKPRFNVEKILPYWARILEKQTGSPKLPLLRTIGGVATLISATISVWDSYRAYKAGDYALSASYAVIATGSILWGLYAIGLVANPLALLIGVGMAIGGVLHANILSDNEAELAVRYGPFGTDALTGQMPTTENPQHFMHLKDPLIAYQQLAGILGKPKITVMRLADWRRQAPASNLEALQAADQGRKPPTDTHTQTIRPDYKALNDEDWVVTLSTPLLATFGNDSNHLQLVGHEFHSTLDTGQAYATRQHHWQPSGTPKLAAVPLNANSVLYVLPSFIEASLSSARFRRTEGMKISLQVELRAEPDSPPLVLPQPHPKKWQPFTPGHRRAPPGQPPAENLPLYWQIETVELSI
ncbi:hypothetical protein ALQ04_05428 [Pseudomonas cichorii]|uniref:Uncharacterized protein n=1 Tax=Pseudomonas cichorii TaxID=36746 RepID=A0A3M4M888_PSECI|nr:hypothetical protein [Pseudomonas cichorii]RMQ50098.1 hypothetical protein ALQ04_05428 [Pseudomonas cichorii]